MNTPDLFASIIALDGPAASGKSTIGKQLADQHAYLFFDTGVMYRAVTWLALQHDTDPADAAGVARLAVNSVIDVRPPSQADGRTCDVSIDGQDVTWEIRQPQVDSNVSIASAHAEVRRALSAQQRRIGLRGQVVMAGRDIGTVVLPEAGFKFYLDASPQERARRRYEELRQRGQGVDYDTILAAVLERDRIDSTRDIAPLRPAEHAIIIDTDQKSIAQVVAEINGWLTA